MTTLANLRTNFLVSVVDMYNGDDLTGTNSIGDKADRCINQALQKMRGIVGDTPDFAADPDTSSIVSTANQAFIELSAISTLHRIKNITETTNDVKLIRIPFWQYRQINPDPANASGVPTRYARNGGRIYLHPTPSAVVTYTVDFEKTVADLTSNDSAALGAEFDYWILAEAHVFWQRMMDPADTAAMATITAVAADARQQALRDIYAEYEGENVSQSQWNRSPSDGLGLGLTAQLGAND